MKTTGAVLVDLSAAYDTVWTGGLMYKLAKVIPCRKIPKILSTMTNTRQFHVVLGGRESRTRNVRNGVLQNSVIAPTLFNVYISDIFVIVSITSLPYTLDDLRQVMEMVLKWCVYSCCIQSFRVPIQYTLERRISGNRGRKRTDKNRRSAISFSYH